MNITLAHMMKALVAAQVGVLSLNELCGSMAGDMHAAKEREVAALAMILLQANSQLTLIRKQVKQGTL